MTRSFTVDADGDAERIYKLPAEVRGLLEIELMTDFFCAQMCCELSRGVEPKLVKMPLGSGLKLAFEFALESARGYVPMVGECVCLKMYGGGKLGPVHFGQTQP